MGAVKRDYRLVLIRPDVFKAEGLKLSLVCSSIPAWLCFTSAIDVDAQPLGFVAEKSAQVFGCGCRSISNSPSYLVRAEFVECAASALYLCIPASEFGIF